MPFNISMKYFLYSLTLPVLFFNLSLAAEPGDTTITFNSDSTTRYLPWIRIAEGAASRRNISVSATEALHGQYGFQLKSIVDQSSSAYQILPCLKESWQRFYFRVDTCLNQPDIPAESLFCIFLQFSTGDEFSSNQEYGSLLSFTLAGQKTGDGLSLLSITPPSSGRNSADTCRIPVNIGQIYCLESYLNFMTAESAGVKIFLDGREKWNVRFLYTISRKNLFFQLNTFTPFFRDARNNLFYAFKDFVMSFDDMAMGAERFHALPPRPQNCRSNSGSNNVTFSADSFKTKYSGESIRSVQWRLYSASSVDSTAAFPVYEYFQQAPCCFYIQRLPFVLDTGTYYWQTKWQNNFKNWGEWSRADTFRITEQSPSVIMVRNVYFTGEYWGKPLTTITAGRWYNLHIDLQNKTAWDTLVGYVIVWLNDSSYTEGHPGNKGGKFLESSSYIYNISIVNGQYDLFEKKSGEEIGSKALHGNSIGQYMDNRKGNLVVDTVAGHIKIRVRLLSNARSGNWRVSSYAQYREGLLSNSDMVERQSNIFRGKIKVSPHFSLKGYYTNFRLFAGLLGIGVLLFVFIGVLWKRKKGKSVLAQTSALTEKKAAKPTVQPVENDEFEHIMKYIRENYNQELSYVEIRKKFGFNHVKFHKLLKKNNVKLPELINTVRIEKAKYLLLTSNKSISEIGYDVGFNESNYFSKVFKLCEGISPLDFRLKSKNV